MNAAQIHLALNHVPLILSITGGGILIAGMIIRNESFKTLSLFLLVAAALFTAPVFLTGEGTEEMVEELAGVAEAAIDKHADMAKISLIVIIITGIIALAGLILRKNAAIARVVFPVALLFSLASFGTMAQTAHLGGMIRHTEIRNGAVASENSNENEEGEEKEGKNPVLNNSDSNIMAADSIPQETRKNEQVKKDDDD